jgi:hypothetical protein
VPLKLQAVLAAVDIGASEGAGVSPSAAKQMKRLAVDRSGFALFKQASTSSGCEP